MLAYKKFTKNVGLITAVNVLIVLKAIIFLPLITKMLGAFSYGVWAQLLVTVGLLVPIIRLGLTNSITRFIAAEKDNEEIQEGVYSSLFLVTGLSLVVSIIFLLFIHPISQFFQAPFLLTAVLPLIILFEVLNTTLLSVFQGLFEMRKFSFFMIVLSLLEIMLVIASIYRGYGLIGAVLSLLCAKAIAFVLIYLNIYTTIGFKIPTFYLVKRYLSFGLPTLLSNASYLAVTSIDKYIIGVYLGTLFVGYYAPAYSLGNFVTFLIIPIGFVLLPALSKSYDEDKIYEVKTKLRYSLKYFLMVAIPTVCGITVLIKQILTIFTTHEIASNAFFVTPLVASSILFYGSSDIFSQILTLVKKTKIIGLIWGAAAVVNIVLNLLLIPQIGILGAALATLTAYLFAFLLIWYYAFKELSFHIDWYAITKILLCSLAMSLLVWKMNPSGLVMTMITVCVGVSFYGLLVIVTKVFTPKELSFFKDLIKK